MPGAHTMEEEVVDISAVLGRIEDTTEVVDTPPPRFTHAALSYHENVVESKPSCSAKSPCSITPPKQTHELQDPALGKRDNNFLAPCTLASSEYAPDVQAANQIARLRISNCTPLKPFDVQRYMLPSSTYADDDDGQAVHQHSLEHQPNLRDSQDSSDDESQAGASTSCWVDIQTLSVTDNPLQKLGRRTVIKGRLHDNSPYSIAAAKLGRVFVSGKLKGAPGPTGDPREDFLTDLSHFLSELHIDDRKIPTVGGGDLDIYRLTREVLLLGGAKNVVQMRGFRVVRQQLQLPESGRSEACVLKQAYEKLCYLYEQKLTFDVHPETPQGLGNAAKETKEQGREDEAPSLTKRAGISSRSARRRRAHQLRREAVLRAQAYHHLTIKRKSPGDNDLSVSAPPPNPFLPNSPARPIIEADPPVPSECSQFAPPAKRARQAACGWTPESVFPMLIEEPLMYRPATGQDFQDLLDSLCSQNDCMQAPISKELSQLGAVFC